MCQCITGTHQRFCKQPHIQALRHQLRQSSERIRHVGNLQKHAAGLLRLHGKARVGRSGVRGLGGNGEQAVGVADCADEFRVVCGDVPRFNRL